MLADLVVPGGDGDPAAIAAAKGFEAMDTSALEAAVDAAIAALPDAWATYVGGQDKAAGALVGAVMKATKGQADGKGPPPPPPPRVSPGGGGASEKNARTRPRRVGLDQFRERGGRRAAAGRPSSTRRLHTGLDGSGPAVRQPVASSWRHRQR